MLPAFFFPERTSFTFFHPGILSWTNGLIRLKQMIFSDYSYNKLISRILISKVSEIYTNRKDTQFNFADVKPEDKIIMKAISICFKPLLTASEGMIFLGLGKSEFYRKLAEYGVKKLPGGIHYSREDLIRIGSTKPTYIQDKVNELSKKMKDKFIGF